jgi:hypothetical protein
LYPLDSSSPLDSVENTVIVIPYDGSCDAGDQASVSIEVLRVLNFLSSRKIRELLLFGSTAILELSVATQEP